MTRPMMLAMTTSLAICQTPKRRSRVGRSSARQVLAARAQQDMTDQRWSSTRGQEPPASQALARRIFSLADKRLVMSALSYLHGDLLAVKRLAMSALCSTNHDNRSHLTAELMPALAPENTQVEKRIVPAQSHV